MQPELGVACSTDSHGLLVKKEEVVAVRAASRTRGGGPFVVWAPRPQGCHFPLLELSSPQTPVGIVHALPDPACARP